MQDAGDTALAAAIAASNRHIIWSLEIDWNQDGLFNHALSDMSKVVDSMVVTRAYETTLPKTVTLVEGSSAARLDIQLSGKRAGDLIDLAFQLSPWRTDGAFYHGTRMLIPIRASLGVRTAAGTGPMQRQFTGFITDFATNRKNRSVTISAYDGVELLRTPMQFPLLSLSTYLRDLGWQYYYNPQAVLDLVLRKSGFYMSPPAPANCVMSLPWHGAPLPEIGYRVLHFAASQSNVEDLTTPGVYGLAGNAHRGMLQYVGVSFDRILPFENTKTSMQGLFKFGPNVYNESVPDYWTSFINSELFRVSDNESTTEGVNWAVNITSSAQLQFKAYNNSTLLATVNGPTVTTYGWHNIACCIEIGATLASTTIRWSLDEVVTTASVDLTGWNAVATSGLYEFSSYETWGGLPMQCIQLLWMPSTEDVLTRWYKTSTFQSTADIDPCLNLVSGIPPTAGVPGWDVIKDVVSAELGVFGFTEFGRPFFKNRDNVRRQSINTVKTLDVSQGDLKDLTLRERIETVQNVISVNTNAVYETGTPEGLATPIWVLSNVGGMIIPPGESTFQISLPRPSRVKSASWFIQRTSADYNSTSQSSAFVATLADNPSVEAAYGTVGVRVVQKADWQTVKMFIFNTNTGPIQFATDTGQPALSIGGWFVESTTAENRLYSSAGSIARFGARTLQLPSTPYTQIQVPFESIALGLLRDLQNPVAELNSVPAVGDPRLQLLDSMQIKDAGGLGGDIPVMLWGYQRALKVNSTGGILQDDLDMRPFAAPGTWILGHPVYSILGSTTILG